MSFLIVEVCWAVTVLLSLERKHLYFLKRGNKRNVKDTSWIWPFTRLPRGPEVSYPLQRGWQTWIASREVCRVKNAPWQKWSQVANRWCRKLHYTLWFWTNSRAESEFKESNKFLPSIHQCKWKQVHILKIQKAHHSAKLGQSKWRTWALLSCKYPVANRSNQWTSPLACPKIPNQNFCVWAVTAALCFMLLQLTYILLRFAISLGKLMVCKFKGRPVYSSLDVNSQSPDQLFHPGTETRQAAICIKEGSTPAVPGSPCRADQTLDLPHKQWQPRKEGLQDRSTDSVASKGVSSVWGQPRTSLIIKNRIRNKHTSRRSNGKRFQPLWTLYHVGKSDVLHLQRPYKTNRTLWDLWDLWDLRQMLWLASPGAVRFAAPAAANPHQEPTNVSRRSGNTGDTDGTGDTILRSGLLPLQYKTWWSCLPTVCQFEHERNAKTTERGEEHWLARNAFFLRCHDTLQGALLKQVLTSIFPICAVTSSEKSQHQPQS